VRMAGQSMRVLVCHRSLDWGAIFNYLLSTFAITTTRTIRFIVAQRLR
jgi:hypothetical protein